MWNQYAAEDCTHRSLPGSVQPRLQTFPSAPLPQRLSAQDTDTYVQPIPHTSGNYQTFWTGNQLPGSYMHITPHTQYIVYRTQDFVQPQLNTQASFGRNVGTLNTASILANWRTVWASASARYGNT